REPQREVQAQLDVISPMLELRGYAPAYPSQTGQAPVAQDQSHAFTLEKGVSYLVTARCDAACGNVDLGLFDTAGLMVQQDTDSDDYPTMAFVATESGSYRVTVRVAQCAAEACAYGVAVFRRDAGPRQTKAGM
ncbi:MAG TPA: hypothetical protein VEX86_24270, partial [Longimicrobium sp.]|nr:hypothetical protein [Longimicrobium sp.]